MANSHAPDTPHWEAAFEYYYQDQMVESYVEIRDHGVGEAGELLRWYRVIEAESETRLKSEVLEVNDWLSLEFVPDETMGLEIELGRTRQLGGQLVEVRLHQRGQTERRTIEQLLIGRIRGRLAAKNVISTDSRSNGLIRQAGWKKWKKFNRVVIRFGKHGHTPFCGELPWLIFSFILSCSIPLIKYS